MLKKTKIALLVLSSLALVACEAEDEGENSNNTTSEIRFNDVVVDEGADGQTETATIDIRLSRSLNTDIALPYATKDGTAVAGIDYEQKEGTLVIPRGSATATVEIDVIGNDHYGPERSFTVEFKKPAGTELEASAAVITVKNDDPVPVVNFSQDVRAVQDNAGTIYLDVRTSHASFYEGRVDLEFSGIANKGTRYLVEQEQVTFEPHETHVRVPITIVDDNVPRGGENIKVTLKSPRHIEVGELAETNVVIQGNTRLPDSGVLKYYNYADNAFTASAPDAEHLYQDADFGLDAEEGVSSTSDGYASLSYTKLDRDGNRMPNDSVDYYCVRDNQTGVVYEANKADYGFRDRNNTYIWVNEDKTTNGGGTAIPNARELQEDEETQSILVGQTCSFPKPNGNSGVRENRGCSTENYLRFMNSQSFCGFSDWRLPTIQELQNAVRFEAGESRFDDNFFADGQGLSMRLLSATPSADNNQSAWCVDSDTGRRMLCVKNNRFHVRATRTPIPGSVE
jgi:hypothetical protein